ncbi:MAG: SDR family NAD(P)-dependent oxidoreductase, partial [Pseudomonadales bacterium]|nr:SDR family NAD(P)-dependent oxidoreductase [Pseudomonadales bacterium]
MSKPGALTTTTDLIKGVDLSGKTAVITGASSGLGLETAYSLARTGCQVVLCARDKTRLKACVEDVKSETANPNIHAQLIDLQDLSSVRKAAAKIAAEFPRIHFLINNAGVMATPFTRLENGFEQQFGVNHLAHFLFTLLLEKNLQAAAPSRVINLSSGGHKHASVDLDDLHWEKRPYNKWQAYGQSKTANVLFTFELDQRWKEKGVRAFAVHPGAIPTNLGRHLTDKDIEDLMNNSVGRG